MLTLETKLIKAVQGPNETPPEFLICCHGLAEKLTVWNQEVDSGADMKRDKTWRNKPKKREVY